VPASPTPSTLADLGPALGADLRIPWLDVKDRRFGAKGDGVADDTAAIQLALDAARAAGGATVFVPPGTYKTTATLLLYSNTTLRGFGWTSIIKGAAGANPIIKGTDPTQGLVEGCSIERLKIDGTSIATGLTGIYWTRYLAGAPVTAGRNNSITGVRVSNCDVGIRCIWDQGLAIRSCYIESNRIGLYASDNSQLGYVSQCDFRYNTEIGTLLEASNTVITPTVSDPIYGWHFDRCHWESNTGKGLVLDGASNNTFETCKWENNSDDYIRLTDAVSTRRPDGNVFINGLWNGTVGVPTVKQLNMLKAFRTLFLGGVFNAANNAGLTIAAGVTGVMFKGVVIADLTKLVSAGDSTTFEDGYADLTYGTTITPDMAQANILGINVTNGTAFTIANPTHGSTGQRLTFDILNSSGGAMGAITWGAMFKLAGAFTNPANGKRRTISFYDNGANWVETNRAAADI
jgi:hypothetical protein